MRLNICFFVCLYISAAGAQTLVVTHNTNLRPDASSSGTSLAKLTPGETLKLLDANPTSGYYHVQTPDGKVGFVSKRSVQVESDSESQSTTSGANEPAATEGSAPRSGELSPILVKQHPVDWWFVFKFNSATFPGCGGTATRSCPFGGAVQSYKNFSQQFVYASSENRILQNGGDCLGDSVDDPVGATFDEVYSSTLYYVVWNDQFYDDPQIRGCTTSCGAPWGHSKGMLAWNDTGSGIVLQVTTPSWPASGSKNAPRKTDGNSLGCVKDNDVQVSQHFFALKLSKDDLTKVLKALHNASVVTDPSNPQIVKNGGPADVQQLVISLGVKTNSKEATNDVLSTNVRLISKPSGLHVPPWQMVSAILSGISLRSATWWANPKIPSTSSATKVICWDSSLPTPGPVEIATTGRWAGKEIGLTGGLGTNFNHAKIGVSTSGTHNFSIFADMNQQGTITGPNCSSSQNGRGGLFYVVDDADLSRSVADLISGSSAPIPVP